ncbi:hypothetical protein VCUG_01173 [Vavraia culicis subsp. floridensis]|uniref:DUF2415 domain-containing protein n=1 Tax=Vavraia culicis (isolate floridensis) TaxID=948595 RepID=L2GUI0_VAVCU|nr:uncharacterized protein VCUG_01173 [Vavraia culicis subsp. floridensis]ELA47289.1 hypothetical protein VCUG_01173 [Vavraia culicis subsp. floridensis]
MKSGQIGGSLGNCCLIAHVQVSVDGYVSYARLVVLDALFVCYGIRTGRPSTSAIGVHQRLSCGLFLTNTCAAVSFICCCSAIPITPSLPFLRFHERIRAISSNRPVIEYQEQMRVKTLIFYHKNAFRHRTSMTIHELRDTCDFVQPECLEHSIAVPVQHWQLRDMLKGTSNSLVFCQGNKVCKFNVPTGALDDIITDLSFFPTSISATDSLVVVGGQKGQYAVKNLENERFVLGTVGHAINNAVKICEFNGETNFLFCNNDNTIRRYSYDSLDELEMITHPWPVNNCEMSLDGKHLVSVGDTNQIFYFNVEGGKFVKDRTLKSMNDGGFKVSWNATSTSFAISTQDGYICIYDTRNLTKNMVIRSKQNRSIKGACRNVEFSKKRSLDLLIFTEHVSYFTLLDARDYENKQSIKVFDDMDKQISGSAFLEDQEKVFISMDDKIIQYKLENRRTFGSYCYDAV